MKRLIFILLFFIVNQLQASEINYKPIDLTNILINVAKNILKENKIIQDFQDCQLDANKLATGFIGTLKTKRVNDTGIIIESAINEVNSYLEMEKILLEEEIRKASASIWH
jgi:hypothetical protein